MTWTYDSSDLDKDTSAGRVNVVRYLVGDTNTSDQQVQDEEITFALTESNDDVYYAASFVAGTIASLYARKVDIELDTAIKESLSGLSKQYRDLSAQLRQTAQVKSGGGLGSFGGGLTVTSVEAKRANDNLIKPSFTRDRFRPEDVEYNKLDYDEE